MFFLPRVIYTKRNKVFLKFDLSPIPKDMNTLRIKLHIPPPDANTPISGILKGIKSKWRVKKIRKGVTPIYSHKYLKINSNSMDNTIQVVVTKYSKTWREPLKNNTGIYLRLKKQRTKYLRKEIPYLIVTTD